MPNHRANDIPIGSARRSNGQPGIGFALSLYSPKDFPLKAAVSFPENDLSVNESISFTQRKNYQTLLFGNPVGARLSFMNFNVRRMTSAMKTFAGVLDFDEVPDEKIARNIGRSKAEIVALEEMWDYERMLKMLDWANEERKAKLLPPYYFIGPPMESTLGVGDLYYDQLHGGAFLWTSLPKRNSMAKAYDSDYCKGEDCLKDKGIVYVQLDLAEKINCDNLPAAKQGDCRKKPTHATGDEYIDVFMTHTQANPVVCGSSEGANILEGFGTWLAAALLLPATILDPALLEYWVALQFNGFHCFSADPPTARESRALQLKQLNNWISFLTDGSRPTVIMGDMNIEGRLINNGEEGSEYDNLIDILGVGSPGLETSAVNTHAPADKIYPIDSPYGVEGVIYHGDMIRNTFSIEELTTHTTGFGTAYNGVYSPEDEWSRLDYIMLRPPHYPTNESPGDEPRWLALNGHYTREDREVGQQTGTFNFDTTIMSDHTPISATLEFVPFYTPPSYHPTWPHEVTHRIISASSTQSDGGAGAWDPFPRNIYMRTYHTDSTWTDAQAHDGSECTDTASEAFGVDGCMNDWVVTGEHRPGIDTKSDTPLSMYDDDGTEDDPACIMSPPCDAVMGIEYSTGKVYTHELLTGVTTSTPGWEGGLRYRSGNGPLVLVFSEHDHKYLCFRGSHRGPTFAPALSHPETILMTQHNSSTSRFPHVALLALVLPLMLLGGEVSCSSDGSNTGTSAAAGASGTAGTSATAGAGGTTSGSGGTSGTPTVCENACASVQTCVASGFTQSYGEPPEALDASSCVTQCEKERKGEGVLAQDVAEQFFTDLAAVPSDTNCSSAYSAIAIGWGPYMNRIDESTSAGQPFEVQDPDAIEHCVDVSYSCRNLVDSPRETFYAQCFLDNYRYNDAIRTQASACDAKVQSPPLACDDRDSCKYQQITSTPEVNHQTWFGDQPVLVWLAQNYQENL